MTGEPACKLLLLGARQILRPQTGTGTILHAKTHPRQRPWLGKVSCSPDRTLLPQRGQPAGHTGCGAFGAPLWWGLGSAGAAVHGAVQAAGGKHGQGATAGVRPVPRRKVLCLLPATPQPQQAALCQGGQRSAADYKKKKKKGTIFPVKTYPPRCGWGL